MTDTHHVITRKIGIDAGHRLPFHGSKCSNIHGHRYTVEAVCEGQLFDEGEQQGMVLDFGFLKEEMIEHIDGPCDHGFIAWVNDDVVLGKFFETEEYAQVKDQVENTGCWSGQTNDGLKLYVVPFAPTAENLAKHWFELLAPHVASRSVKKASLRKIVVWETPNCSAEYPIA